MMSRRFIHTHLAESLDHETWTWSSHGPQLETFPSTQLKQYSDTSGLRWPKECCSRGRILPSLSEGTSKTLLTGTLEQSTTQIDVERVDDTSKRSSLEEFPSY